MRKAVFRIYPFLARVMQTVTWRRDEREVAEILDVSLAELSAAEVGLEDAPGEQQAPYYRIGEYRLWGVTFRLLNPLVQRLLSGEWPIKA